MLETIGLLGGAVARLLPIVVSFFEKGRDLKYELLRMEWEVKLEQARSDAREREVAAVDEARTNRGWSDALVEALRSQGKVTGDRWLDRINVSVRPVLTYWWCVCMYTLAKACLVYAAFHENVGAREMAAIILTDFDRAVVGSIIGFWFVDRALRKATALR